jgi:hypothetical protein
MYLLCPFNHFASYITHIKIFKTSYTSKWRDLLRNLLCRPFLSAHSELFRIIRCFRVAFFKSYVCRPIGLTKNLDALSCVRSIISVAYVTYIEISKTSYNSKQRKLLATDAPVSHYTPTCTCSRLGRNTTCMARTLATNTKYLTN